MLLDFTYRPVTQHCSLIVTAGKWMMEALKRPDGLWRWDTVCSLIPWYPAWNVWCNIGNCAESASFKNPFVVLHGTASVCLCVYYVGSVYWPLSSAHDKLSHVKLGIILDVQFKHGDELTGSLLFSASRVQLNKQTKKNLVGKWVKKKHQFCLHFFLQGRKWESADESQHDMMLLC